MAASSEGWNAASVPFSANLIEKGGKRRNSRGALSAYPPFAFSQRGRALARLVISESRPKPAIEEKYFDSWPFRELPASSIVPRSTLRTFSPVLRNLVQ